jgi:hypothetical protein
MSGDVRAVAMDAEQASLIEELGLELMRQGDERSTRLLTIFLAWKISSRATLSNIPTAFRCDPDESAGLAEVVELHGYSKRAPCA